MKWFVAANPAASRRIGLALDSGSPRSWSRIVVVEALADADIEPDIVCASLIGAVVGAAKRKLQ